MLIHSTAILKHLTIIGKITWCNFHNKQLIKSFYVLRNNISTTTLTVAKLTVSSQPESHTGLHSSLGKSCTDYHYRQCQSEEQAYTRSSHQACKVLKACLLEVIFLTEKIDLQFQDIHVAKKLLYLELLVSEA